MKTGKLLMISMVIICLFAFSTNTVVSIDESEIITDPADDVYSFDYFSLEDFGATNYITKHDDIDIKNIDIREITYDRQDISVTLKLKVEGEIENRGDFIDADMFDFGFENLNSIIYNFTLITTDNGIDNTYQIVYANNTCRLINPDFDTVNLSEENFNIQNKNTLVINFELESGNEIFNNLTASTLFLKFNFEEVDLTDPEGDFSDIMVFLTDIAPNPPVEAIAIVREIGIVGMTIDFNGSAWLGEPPYEFLWDFGDGSKSTKQSPTHIYNKPGKYEYVLTVTDNSGDTASFSHIIDITGNGGETNNAPIIMFIGVIIIIAVIGIIAVIYIIRR